MIQIDIGLNIDFTIYIIDRCLLEFAMHVLCYAMRQIERPNILIGLEIFLYRLIFGEAVCEMFGVYTFCFKFIIFSFYLYPSFLTLLFYLCHFVYFFKYIFFGWVFRCFKAAVEKNLFFSFFLIEKESFCTWLLSVDSV
jgi:hypothetical protein